MEMEVGKLFVGGISWETNEEGLKEYFQAFGDVLEAVIMKDRATGRARGFGFVVFADASVAERVVRERHVIDGRTVEAKKAVPRDDHQNPNRNNNNSSSSSSTHGSPSPARSKKIFVGGLPSTITESDFKKYFDQFGTITDVVVMYDHNTQRPRGFGFITYDSEESVDRVLVRTFHELNGKTVEVKQAIPKDLSPGPVWSPSSGHSHSYGPNRAAGLFNCYSPVHSGLNSAGRFSTIGRVRYPPYSPGHYSVGSNLETGWGLNYGSSVDSCVGYRNGMEYSYFGGTSSENGFFLSTNNRDGWGNVNPNYVTNSGTSSDFLASGGLGNLGEIWGGSYASAKERDGIIYGGMAGYKRGNVGVSNSSSFFSSMDNVRDSDKGFEDSYVSDSFYSNHAWQSLSQEVEGSGTLGYGLGDRPADAASNNPVGYVGDYRVNSSNRGIAA